MNPETNKFEMLYTHERQQAEIDRLQDNMLGRLLRPNGQPVPKNWTVFTVGELVTIKDYTFKVAYVGETSILFEPVKPTDVLPQTGGPR